LIQLLLYLVLVVIAVVANSRSGTLAKDADIFLVSVARSVVCVWARMYVKRRRYHRRDYPGDDNDDDDNGDNDSSD